MEVARDNYLPGAYLSHLAELIFGRECLVLAYLLEEAEHECLVLLDVVYEDYLLVGVSIPELGLVFVVKVRIPVDD